MSPAVLASCTDTVTRVPTGTDDIAAVGFDGSDGQDGVVFDDVVTAETDVFAQTDVDWGDGDADSGAPDVALTDATDGGDGDVVDFMDGVLAGVLDTDDVVEGEDTGDVDAVEPDAGPTLEPLAPRSCTQRFEHRTFEPHPATVALAGEFNGWNVGAASLSHDGAGSWTIDLDTTAVVPGPYAYKFVENETNWVIDGGQPLRRIVGGVENSKVLVDDCSVPALELETLTATPASLEVVVAVRGGGGVAGAGLTPGTSVVLRGGVPFESGWTWDANSQRFTVSIKSPPPGKYGLELRIAGPGGAAVPLYLPIWIEAVPFDWRDSVLYFVMTDRFLDGDKANSAPSGCLPDGSKANWLGGDWAGITQKIEAGYFDDLGVNALWLTAVVDNPDGCEPGAADGRTYTSYHGYFPSAQLTPESHLGTLAELQALSAAAHARGIRVMVDLVANHLHSSHPYVAEHTDDGWFYPYGGCQNGGFDNAPLTCWFETYLPDLNYGNDAVVEAMTDMAVEWVRLADLDGYRVDAVKHMHPNFLRTLVWKLRRHAETVPGARFYTVGETFTGEWGGGFGPNETLIKAYVSPELLDGQFDFPLYWNVVKAFARGETGLSTVADVVTQSQGYYGAGSIMSAFLGNHDVPRFVSHAAGQIGDVWGNGSKDQGWNTPPGQPAGSDAYEKLGVAFAFLFTAPGIPLVYYGDEIGLAGSGDPDNRRMMPWTGYADGQVALRDKVGQLGKARAALPALRRGGWKTLKADGDVLVYERSGAGLATVVVGLNRGAGSSTATVSAQNGTYTEFLTGATATASGGSFSLDLAPRSAEVWVEGN